MPWTPPPQPVLLTDRFSFVIKLIFMALGNRSKTSPVSGPFALLIFRRICALRNRFFATLARGPSTPRPPSAPRPARTTIPQSNPTPTATQSTTQTAPLRLPTRFGWLLRLFPQSEIATARGQLTTLLDDPEMIALLATHPTLGRSLRPLCRLLSITPPATLCSAPQRPPRAPKPGKTPTPRRHKSQFFAQAQPAPQASRFTAPRPPPKIFA